MLMSHRGERNVPKVPEQFDLSQCSLAKHGVIKRGDSFDGDFGIGGEVGCRAAA